ncbi:MAG: hypothetical protein O3C17_27325, partial [Planctomycetota bacterium]|nr:hypothetical protein [Planctomycetota bacterium]
HQALYDTIPETLQLRELRFTVQQPGYRTSVITIATTLTDADLYTKAEIAELYGFRWNSELDIRSIKQSLNLSALRNYLRHSCLGAIHGRREPDKVVPGTAGPS